MRRSTRSPRPARPGWAWRPVRRDVYDQVDLSVPVAVVLGSEAHGLPSDLSSRLDRVVSVPMAGQRRIAQRGDRRRDRVLRGRPPTEGTRMSDADEPDARRSPMRQPPRARCGSRRDGDRGHGQPRAAQPAHVDQGLHVVAAEPVGPPLRRPEADDARADPARRRPGHPADHGAPRHQPARGRAPDPAPAAARDPRRGRAGRRAGDDGLPRPASRGPRCPPTCPGCWPTPTRSSRC